MFSGEYSSPRGLSARAPLAITSAASGMSAVTTRSPGASSRTDMAVRHIDPARHLQRSDVLGWRRAQRLVRHQRHLDLQPLRRPIENVLNDRRTRVSVNPDMHGVRARIWSSYASAGLGP